MIILNSQQEICDRCENELIKNKRNLDTKNAY